MNMKRCVVCKELKPRVDGFKWIESRKERSKCCKDCLKRANDAYHDRKHEPTSTLKVQPTPSVINTPANYAPAHLKAIDALNELVTQRKVLLERVNQLESASGKDTARIKRDLEEVYAQVSRLQARNSQLMSDKTLAEKMLNDLTERTLGWVEARYDAQLGGFCSYLDFKNAYFQALSNNSEAKAFSDIKKLFNIDDTFALMKLLEGIALGRKTRP